MKTPDIEHPPEETLQAFLLGETDEKTESEIRAHLMDCRECHDRAQTLAATLDLLRDALSAPIAGAECIPEERRARIHDLARKKHKREKRRFHLFASSRSRKTRGKWFSLRMLANVAAILVVALFLGSLLMPGLRSVSEHARHEPTVRSYLFDGPMDQAPPPMEIVVFDAMPEAVNAVDIPLMTPDADPGPPPADMLESSSPVAMRGLYAGRASRPAEDRRREAYQRYLEEYEPEELAALEAPPVDTIGAGITAAGSGEVPIAEMDGDGLARLRTPRPADPSSPVRFRYQVGQTQSEMPDVGDRGVPRMPQPPAEAARRPSAAPSPSPPPPPRPEPRTDMPDDAAERPVFRLPSAVRFNAVVETERQPFSTFSIDTDTASFTMARRAIREGRRPDPATVRPEEFINYFDYQYPAPREATFRIETVASPSPFRDGFVTLKIGVRGRGDRTAPPPRQTVLTVLIDGSGSMSTPDRIGMVRQAMPLLLDGLRPHDLITLIRFDRTARLLLPPTPVEARDRILDVIETMEPSGSTNIEEGLRVAYATAARHYRRGAANRVLLFSDGVANLGAETADDILATVAGYRQRGIDLSVFGLGLGTYDDRMLKTLAARGDGSYTYLDSVDEARRVFVDEAAAAWHVIARDVRIQVEFDPDRVPRYRQIGYEPRQLTPEQFRDDRIDAGEVGYGRSVTALYELVVDSRRSGPLGVVRVRYRDPDSGEVRELEQAVTESALYPRFENTPPRFQLAAAVAEWAEWLRNNPAVAGVEPASIREAMARAVDALPLDDQVRETLMLMDAGGLLR